MASEKFTIRFLACVSAFAAIIILVFTCIMGASWPIAVFFAAAIAGVDILAFRNLTLCKPQLEQTLAPLPSPPPRKIWLALLVVSVLIAFAGLSMLLYSSWLSGDDFVILGLSSLPLKERIIIAGGSYFHWVPRVGELIANIGGISPTRWQIWIINPLLLLSVPFILWHIARSTQQRSICSSDGIIFFWAILILMMLPESKGWWLDFSVHVASVTYFWPSVASLLLVALIVRAGHPRQPVHPWKTIGTYCGMLVLGAYCGWGNECTTVFLFSGSFAYLLYHSCKKIRLPLHTFPAFMGIIIGSMLQFLSTAHAYRAIKAESFRAIQPENMPFDKVLDFVQNLTADKVALLGGDNVVLTGIPLYLHAYFFPFMAKLFLPMAIPFMAVLAVLLPMLCYRRNVKWIVFALSGMLIAWGIAASYLTKCIPTSTSFLPPAFILLATCALVLYQVKTWQKAVVLLLLVVAAAITFLPSAHEVLLYKKYEQASYSAVSAQIAAGKQDVVLPRLYATTPENKLGLIDSRSISSNSPSDIYNSSLAKWLNIRSIVKETPSHSGSPEQR